MTCEIYDSTYTYYNLGSSVFVTGRAGAKKNEDERMDGCILHS